MGILVLTSTGGSPGVTTLAVGLALTWPRPVLLADCDPGAHQSVLAGYLIGQSVSGKGLLRVAEAHRDRRPLREVVLDQAVPLTSEDDRRALLPGFARPGSAGLFGSVWPDFVDALDRLGDVDMDVIVDAGRLTASGLPAPLVEHTALTVLVSSSNLRSVMSARVHLPGLLEQTAQATGPDPLGLVVVGPGRPYGPGEIGRALQLPVLATVPEDSAAARHLSDGTPRPRRFDTSALVRSLHNLADVAARRLERTTARVGG